MKRRWIALIITGGVVLLLLGAGVFAHFFQLPPVVQLEDYFAGLTKDEPEGPREEIEGLDRILNVFVYENNDR